MKYEYKSVSMPYGRTNAINELAQEGWRVVGLGGIGQNLALMERPLPAPREISQLEALGG